MQKSRVIVMISCEMTELSSDILRYYIVMLSERGDWKPPGRWTGHRCRSSRSDDDMRQLRVPRNRTPYRRDACRRRVGEPLRQPRKDGCWRQVPLHTRPWDGRGPAALVAQRRDLSVTDKELHRIRQYLLLIHIQRGDRSRGTRWIATMRGQLLI